MYPFDYVPFLDPTVLGPPVAAVFGAYGAVKLGPPIVRRARQRAYDEACAAEAVRLVIAPTAAMAVDPGAATALIRALHPHQRRALDPWRVGWPSLELRVVWRGGALAWELIAGRQVATGARHALAARYPGVHIDETPVGERLGYPARQREGVTHLRHTLDTVEAVCALGGDDRDDPAALPVALWLTESMSRDVLGGDVRPDAIVALDHAGGSAVVCLEVDEATQHGPIIQGKLEAYERALTGRAGWYLLFVAPNDDRVDWIRTLARAARGQTLAGRGWAVTLERLRAGGIDAPLRSLGPGRDEPPLGTLATDRGRRRSSTPVGSADAVGHPGGRPTAAGARRVRARSRAARAARRHRSEAARTHLPPPS